MEINQIEAIETIYIKKINLITFKAIMSLYVNAFIYDIFISTSLRNKQYFFVYRTT